MKRTNFFKTMLLVGLLGGSSVIISCGGGDDDEPSTIDPTKEIQPEEPTKDEAMSTEDLKARLEKIALEFMGEVPSSDFKEITDFFRSMDPYTEHSYWHSVEEWGDEIYNAGLKDLGTKGTETNKEYGWTEIINYTNYEALVAISNYKGHLTADKKAEKFNVTDANDLQISYKDDNNNDCLIKVEVSGKEAKVYLKHSDDYVDDKSDYKNRTITYGAKRIKEIWAIPENIKVTFTKSGKTVGKITMNTDISGLNGTDWDVAKGKLNTTVAFETATGYKFTFNQLSYEANKKTSASVILSKNSKNLLSMSIAGDISGIPSYNAAAFFSHDDAAWDGSKADMKSALVKVDVLGQLQIQGTIKDVRKFSDALQNASHNDGKEKAFKQYVTEANGYLDVNLFLDNKNVKQANVSFEPLKDGKYWYSEPVLNFFDGSSFAAFSAFFNKKDFKKVIDKFDSLSDGYSNLGK